MMKKNKSKKFQFSRIALIAMAFILPFSPLIFKSYTSDNQNAIAIQSYNNQAGDVHINPSPSPSPTQRIQAEDPRSEAIKSFDKFFAKYSGKDRSEVLYAIFKAIDNHKILSPKDAIDTIRDNKYELINELVDKNNKFAASYSTNEPSAISIIFPNSEGISFGDLAFLGLLTNLKDLKIVDGSTNEASSLKFSSYHDLEWIDRLTSLKEFYLKTCPSLTVAAPISLTNNIFRSSQLTNINLIYAQYNKIVQSGAAASGAVVRSSLFTDFNSKSYWFGNKAKGFIVSLNNSEKSITESSNTEGVTFSPASSDGFDINKTYGKQLSYLDFKQPVIKIDGSIYNKQLIHSEYVWDIPLDKLKNVQYHNIATNEYFTSQQTPHIDQISQIKNIESYYENNFNHFLTEKVKELNIEKDFTSFTTPEERLDALNSTIQVDGQEKPAFLKNGKILYNVNMQNVHYANSQWTKFWTNISQIISNDFIAEDISYYEKFDDFKTHGVNWEDDFNNSKIPAASQQNDHISVDGILNITPYASQFDRTSYLWPFTVYKQSNPYLRNKELTYYSSASKTIYTSAELLVKNVTDPTKLAEFTQLNPEASVDVIPIADPAHQLKSITDPVKVKEYINAQTHKPISVDNTTINYFLFKEKLYWDFDISKIKFIVEDGQTLKYFTNWELLSDSGSSSKAKIYISQTPQIFPTKPLLVNPIWRGQHDHIFIDGKRIDKIISNGTFVWNYDKLSNIKYVDDNFNYYTKELPEIIQSGILPKGLSRIKEPHDIDIAPAESSLLLSGKLDPNNMSIIFENNFILVDNVKYTRRIFRSVVWWIDERQHILDTTKIQYQDVSQGSNGLIENKNFYTNVTTASNFSGNFPTHIRKITTPVKIAELPYKKFHVPKPQNLNDKITVWKNGEAIIIDAYPTDDGFTWDTANRVLINNIHFSNQISKNKREYYVNFVNKDFDNIVELTDAFADKILDSKEPKIVVSDQINDKMYLIYVLSGTAGMSILIPLYLLISKAVKRK